MNTNGIGLGLVISKNIVTQFNGVIDFNSIPDVGSTFTFTIQLGYMDEEEEFLGNIE